MSNHKFPAEVALELLQHIPDGVTEVRCSGLRMSNFPTFSGTARLQSLICAENYLTTATFDGSIFASLVRLDLSRNHLSELPISVLKLNALEHLNVAHNFLSKLPEGLPSALRTIHAQSNQISVLPQSLWQLQELEEVELSRNLITQLDVAVSQTVSLRRLVMHHNPLSVVPAEVYGRTDWEVFDITATPVALSVTRAALPVAVSPVMSRSPARRSIAPSDSAAAVTAERDVLAARLAAEQEARAKAEDAVAELQKQLSAMLAQPQDGETRASLLLAHSQREAAERRASVDRRLKQIADSQLSTTLKALREGAATHQASSTDSAFWLNVCVRM